MSKIRLALVVTQPGHLWNGLQSLLRTVPQIEIIAETKDPAVLMKIGTEMQPELVLLDASLFAENDWSAIRKMKADSPQTKCVAMVDDDQQGQCAQAASVDLILLKGFPAHELIELIESLMEQRGDLNPLPTNSKDEI